MYRYFIETLYYRITQWDRCNPTDFIYVTASGDIEISTVRVSVNTSIEMFIARDGEGNAGMQKVL